MSGFYLQFLVLRIIEALPFAYALEQSSHFVIKIFLYGYIITQFIIVILSLTLLVVILIVKQASLLF